MRDLLEHREITMVNDRLVQLLRCIYRTCEDEIEMSQWDQESARLAEMVARGEGIPPMLQQYLDNSPDCCEEFEALIAMLKAEQAADQGDPALDQD